MIHSRDEKLHFFATSMPDKIDYYRESYLEIIIRIHVFTGII
jgi:hypothetical protein